MHTCGFPTTRLGVQKKNINFLSSFLSLKRTQTRSSSLNKDIYELNVVHNRIQYVAVVIKKVLLS